MTSDTVARPLRQTASAWRNPRLQGRIPELDGLRGLAILLVVTSHYLGPYEHFFNTVPVTRLFWTGVDLFFVLSGFLITGILLDSAESSNYFKVFYLRRAHRILPVYVISISLLLVGLAFELDQRLGTQAIFRSRLPVWVFFFFLQNDAIPWFGAPVWMGVTWSLAIEEQFYLALPAIVRFSKRALPYIASLVIGLSPFLRVVFFEVYRIKGWSMPQAWPFLTVFRLDGLAMGLLLAIIIRNEKSWNILTHHSRMVKVTLSAMFLVFCKLTITEMEDLALCFGLTAIAGLYVTLLASLLLQPRSVLAGILRWRVLRYFGKISYCLYIVHLGIHSVLWAMLWTRIPLAHPVRGLLVTAIAVAICLLIAELSWRMLENPLIRRAHERFFYATEST